MYHIYHLTFFFKFSFGDQFCWRPVVRRPILPETSRDVTVAKCLLPHSPLPFSYSHAPTAQSQLPSPLPFIRSYSHSSAPGNSNLKSFIFLIPYRFFSAYLLLSHQRSCIANSNSYSHINQLPLPISHQHEQKKFQQTVT